MVGRREVEGGEDEKKGERRSKCGDDDCFVIKWVRTRKLGEERR
jgi:hypothetical protein